MTAILKKLEETCSQRVEKRRKLSFQIESLAKRPAVDLLNEVRVRPRSGSSANESSVGQQKGPKDLDLQHVENNVAAMITSAMEEGSHLERIMQLVEEEQQRRDSDREKDWQVEEHLAELQRLQPDCVVVLGPRSQSGRQSPSEEQA